MKNLTPVIGMEIHVQLATKSSMFCGCPADGFNALPNTMTCPVCLGLPGALPVPNKQAIDWTIMLGLALGGNISKVSKFDRKHYFYPDLPKGYQISQYDKPISTGGSVLTSFGPIRIRRVHLEEDTGKLQHTVIAGKKVSLIDFNRSGVPLIEIVTEPDLTSGVQAKEFAQELSKIVRALKISDCDMEKGSMRLEANISWGLNLGYKVEVKNLNSFRFVDKAINFELARQKTLLDRGETIKPETRGWNESKNETFLQRVKETEADYRYFPEPDILPMEFSDKYIAEISRQIPELPGIKEKRFFETYKIKKEYAKLLSASAKLAGFSEALFLEGKKQNLSADSIAGIIINRKIAPDTKNMAKVLKLAKSKIIIKIRDENILRKLALKALTELPKAVSDYKNGKTQALSVILGKVMRDSHGRADPKVTLRILKSII